MSPAQQPQAPTSHKTELAARLKQLRAEHGLSLAQLARATGLSSSFLSLIEQAQSDITIGRLARLAEFYDVELAAHRRRLHAMSWRGLADGTFVLPAEGVPHVVYGRELVQWTREGYGARRRRPSRGEAIVITPPSSVSVLRAGYPVVIDSTVLA